MLDATDAFVAKRPDFPDQDRHLQLLEQRPRRCGRSSPTIAPRSARRAGEPAAARAAARRSATRCARRGRISIAPASSASTCSSSPTARTRRGRGPDEVAREIFRKSEGAVQIYFVAFDTSPEKFAFLKDVGGDVIGAGTGAGAAHRARRHLSGQDPRRGGRRGEREPVKK